VSFQCVFQGISPYFDSAIPAVFLSYLVNMATFGTLSEYDPDTDKWGDYIECIKQFFIANDIGETEDADKEKRRAILLSVCGGKTYALIKKLFAPEAPGEKTFKDIADKVAEYYQPKPSIIVERFKFHTRARKQSESVAEYVATLRGIAEHCEFPDLNNQLRDRLVVGIGIEAVQRRLLSETELTFKTAYDIAQAMESAAKNTADIRGATGTAPSNVNFVKNKRPFKPQQSTQPGTQQTSGDFKKFVIPPEFKSKCLRCGGDAQGCKNNTCRFKNARCNFSKKIGHIQKVCLAKFKHKPKANYVQGDDSLSESVEPEEVQGQGHEYDYEGLYHTSSSKFKCK
jgi:hypothetical protein